MTSYKFTGSKEELIKVVDWIHRERSPKLFFANNKIRSAIIKNNTLYIKGDYCQAKGKIDALNNDVTVNLQAKINPVNKFFLIFGLVFPIGFLLSESVIINGEQNPPLLARMEIFGGLYLIILVFYFLLTVLRKRFNSNLAPYFTS